MRTENPWNVGFPTVTQRANNHITFEVKVSGKVCKAVVLHPFEWTDLENYDLIPIKAVMGWREPTPKTCRIGNHPIDEVTDRGLISFVRVENGEEVEETYACRACDLQDRIRKYATSGVIRTNLWRDAVLRQVDRENVLRAVQNGEADRRLILEQARRLSASLLSEERAFLEPRGGSTEDLERALEKGSLVALGDSNRRFWFDHLCEEMEDVAKVAKEWEQVVWFGGEDRSKSPDPTPGSLQEFVICAEFKKYSAKVDDLEYLSYTICGRSMFEIEHISGCSVWILLAETSSEPRGGIQEIFATKEEAIQIIRRAIEDWREEKIKLVQGELP